MHRHRCDRKQGKAQVKSKSFLLLYRIKYELIIDARTYTHTHKILIDQDDKFRQHKTKRRTQQLIKTKNHSTLYFRIT